MYPNLSSSSFDTTLIISVKIENVYSNILFAISTMTTTMMVLTNEMDFTSANTYWHAFHFIRQSLLPLSAPPSTSSLRSAANSWSHAGCKPQDFLTKYLMRRIRFVFIRLIRNVMWFTQITKIFIIPIFIAVCSLSPSLSLFLTCTTRPFFHHMNISWKSLNLSSNAGCYNNANDEEKKLKLNPKQNDS